MQSQRTSEKPTSPAADQRTQQRRELTRNPARTEIALTNPEEGGMKRE